MPGWEYAERGASLWDFYAAHALAGISGALWAGEASADAVAACVGRHADAMLAERAKRWPPGVKAGAVTLSRGATMVLEWLEKEGGSSYGETNGEPLDELIEKGLAEIVGPDSRGDDFRAVRCTEAGYEYARRNRG